MRYLLTGLLTLNFMFCFPYAEAKVNTTQVERSTQSAVSSSAGIRRFSYMRYYPVKNTFPEEPGWFSSPYNDMYIRAMAIYFLNMQISMQMYGFTHTPQSLTLNFLGVLDGLAGAPRPFDMKQASAFYKKNKEDIDAYFEKIHKGSMVASLGKPSQKQISEWLRLLENLPRPSQRASYLFPAHNFLQTDIPAQTAAPFQTAMAQATAQSAKKVITYNTPQASLEDLDHPVGIHHSHVKHTYRWVKDECFYSTYMLAKLLAGQIATNTLSSKTRLYVITASPKTGTDLIPAYGNSFKLANGSYSLRWQYHTALLVVYPHQGTYVTMVLDNFLGGKTPVSLDKWLSHFHANTVFSAVPFLRNRTTEDAIKTPTKVVDRNVQIGRTIYEPHPVQ